jgi:aminoglycoside 6'-N-acetyltransferase I
MTKAHESALRIHRAEASDRTEWMRMRAALWPEYTPEDHRNEMDDYLDEKSGGAFVAERPDGGLAGFVEATIRPYADACDTSPVGYVEGWYVDPDVRLSGVGRRLVRTAERWARGRGCSEMGSDCLVENEGSLRAHLAIGYEERERLIHFRRWLARPQARPRA